jgi:hypothetical protein
MLIAGHLDAAVPLLRLFPWRGALMYRTGQEAAGPSVWAVMDAYGWLHDLSDDDLLARLLALNLARAAAPKPAASARDAAG